MKCVNIKTGKIAAFFIAALVCSQLTAQSVNLVPNGSFEANDGKIKSLGQLDKVTSWLSPTGAKTDAFIQKKISSTIVLNKMHTEKKKPKKV